MVEIGKEKLRSWLYLGKMLKIHETQGNVEFQVVIPLWNIFNILMLLNTGNTKPTMIEIVSIGQPDANYILLHTFRGLYRRF